MNDQPLLHVAVAVISDDLGRVLITRRPEGVHLGGLWEFPGGKLEPGESVVQALERELLEELGIRPLSSTPLVRVTHRYTDKAVLLDVYRVTAFSGTPSGREGQPFRWVTTGELQRYPLPSADRPILGALCLPDRYLITGEDPRRVDLFAARLDLALSSGIKLVQLRVKGLSGQDYCRLAKGLIQRVHRRGARMLLNGPLEVTRRLEADGLHLTSGQLISLRERPLGAGQLVAASCHNLAELTHAQDLGLDFAVLSPVNPTASHPESRPLGWAGFRALTDQVSIPTYALGGMQATDLRRARECGGQGIAAIRGLWPQSAAPLTPSP